MPAHTASKNTNNPVLSLILLILFADNQFFPRSWAVTPVTAPAELTVVNILIDMTGRTIFSQPHIVLTWIIMKLFNLLFLNIIKRADPVTQIAARAEFPVFPAMHVVAAMTSLTIFRQLDFSRYGLGMTVPAKQIPVSAIQGKFGPCIMIKLP